MMYFAYGSNLFTPWLRSRVPSATAIGMASLTGHRLRWHKRSIDGSGKCDAFRTSEPGDAVLGVVFEMAAAEKADLDRVEVSAFGYVDRVVSVALGTKRVRAFTYMARSSAVDVSLTPYGWYKALVVAGAREHALPHEYIAGIQAQPCVPDVDEGRRGKARELLARAGA